MGLRDKLQATRAVHERPIDAIGEKVFFREFSATESMEIRRLAYESTQASDPLERNRLHREVQARLIQLMVLNENGEREFSPDEIDTIPDQMTDQAFNELAEAATETSGLAASEDDGKKPRGNRKKSSGSGSA